MKKISVITGLLVIAMTIFMAFTIYQPVDTVTYPFTVHVTGCDDCSNIIFCVDNRNTKKPGACDFTAECNPGGPDIQTICVQCGDKSGSATIRCGKTKDVYIEVTPFGAPCDCTNNKRTK